MKRILQAIAIAAASISVFAAAPKNESYTYTNVKIKKPGDLAKQADKLHKSDKRALRISGTLNTQDVKALRRLCGQDEKLNDTDGKVRALDLSNVTFQPGKEAFAWYNNLKDSATLTSPTSLPPVFLYNCNVEEITLPTKTDTIHPWALAWMPLRSLYVADGITVAPYALCCDSLITKLRLPFSTQLYQFSRENVKGLKEVESGGFLFASRSAFCNNPEIGGVMPDIETFTVTGPVGHIDATPFIDNPRLKSITFNGPVYSTGTALASYCDSLQNVTFNAPVGSFNFDKPEELGLPMLKSYTFNSPVLFTNTADIPTLDSIRFKTWEGRDEFLQTYARLIRKMGDASRKKEGTEWYYAGALRLLEYYSDSIECRSILPEYDSLMQEAMSLDCNKTKKEILKESKPYAPAFTDTIRWSYASPKDSMLTAIRIKYNLDSIAGNGDDYSKIKNLTYWIHEVMPHNGSRGDMPATPYDLENLIAYAQKDSAGGNCRILAIALTQALLAEGIPARYLTCQSKAYDTDSDCHVICAAWSGQHGKWVWCDPTFAAFVTAPDGTPLSPGEVRQRLIDDEEVILNEDANWNHRTLQTKDYYIDEYMAKNLYLISAYNQSRPLTEGPGADTAGLEYITLEPEGFGMKWTHHPTSDESSFWQSPETKK